MHGSTSASAATAASCNACAAHCWWELLQQHSKHVCGECEGRRGGWGTGRGRKGDKEKREGEERGSLSWQCKKCIRCCRGAEECMECLLPACSLEFLCVYHEGVFLPAGMLVHAHVCFQVKISFSVGQLKMSVGAIVQHNVKRALSTIVFSLTRHVVWSRCCSGCAGFIWSGTHAACSRQAANHNTAIATILPTTNTSGDTAPALASAMPAAFHPGPARAKAKAFLCPLGLSMHQVPLVADVSFVAEVLLVAEEKGKEGEGYIAVPAYVGSCAEANKKVPGVVIEPAQLQQICPLRRVHEKGKDGCMATVTNKGCVTGPHPGA
eukprot:224782-Pelagomonas_calceolata.AAC.2